MAAKNSAFIPLLVLERWAAAQHVVISCGLAVHSAWQGRLS
jgi:hypothetical protein